MDAYSFPQESERRWVTVMFADISGFTAMSENMDPEDLTRLAENCFAMMERIILKYQGTVDKFMGDCVMALYGVPKAIENAARNAVLTAIEIKKKLDCFNAENALSIPLNVHVGINTGQVVAGPIGGIVKREYTVMGDMVNVASRIKGVSETGQILVGPATYHAVKYLFHFNTLKPVLLRGKTKLMPVYALLPDEGQHIPVHCMKRRSPASPLVGRDNEMALLEHHLKNLISGKGGIVNLTGEAGIGKSRLITELKNRPDVDDVLLLESSTHTIGRNLPYHVFISMIKNWAGIHDHHTREEAAAKLEDIISRELPEKANDIVPFIIRLMGFAMASRHENIIRDIGGDALEKMMRKSALELLKGLTGYGPLVIVLEDLHWADQSSLQLLSVLFSLVPDAPVLFVNLFRTPADDEMRGFMKNAEQDYMDYFYHIPLQPLNTRHSELLINRLLKFKGLPKTTRNKIVQQAGGNPFFIEEVLRSFVDTGAVREKDGVFELTGKIEDNFIPPSIHGVIMKRIDQLDEESRSLLKVASVIGRHFFHKIIAHVVDNPETMDDSLNVLKKSRFILERRRLSEMEYYFKHALTQEVAYDTLLLQKRRELHGKTARAIECVFKDQLNLFYGMLSYHYSCSEDMDKAEKYMTMAGEEALKSGASSEAVHYYRKALRMYLEKYGTTADPEKIAMIEMNIGLSLYMKGQHAEAKVHIQHTLAYYGVKEPRYGIFLYTGLAVSVIHLMAGLYLPSLKWKKEPTERDIELLNLFYTNVAIQSSLSPGRFVLDCFYLARKLSRFDIAKIRGGAGMLAGLSLTLSWSAISFGLSRKILAFVNKRLDADDTRSLLVFKLAGLMQNYYSGQKIDAFDEHLVENGLRIGEVDHVSGYLAYHGRILLELGHFQETRQIVSRLKEVGEAYSYGIAMALKYYLNTKLLLKFRKLDAALIEAEEGIHYLLRVDFNQILMTLYLSKARIHVLMDQIPAAEKALEQGKRIMSALRVLPPYVSNYCLTCAYIDLSQLETAIKKQDPDGIKQCRKKAGATCRRMMTAVRRIAYDRTEACRLMGRFYRLTGRPEAAFKCWRRSMSEGRRLGARLELARTYMDAGGCLAEQEKQPLLNPGENGKAYLIKAEAIFRDLDLAWDLNALAGIQQKNRQHQQHGQSSDSGRLISV